MLSVPPLAPPDDLAQPFQLEASGLRGRLVRLGAALDAILFAHDYPEPVGALLAEATAIAAALACGLKYDGVFTLQAKSDGAVRMLVADVTSGGGLRAYARFDRDTLDTAKPSSNLLGQGHLAFTVDQAAREGERYQGLVALENRSLTDAAQHYFRQSEQLPTGLMAAARRGADGRWRGGSLLLQRVPREGGTAFPDGATAVEDDWHRAMTLMSTLTPEELTDPALSAHDILFRLFHEEGVRVYDPQPLSAQCRCSETRVRDMLRALPRAEIEALAERDGNVSITCEFCSRVYRFGPAARAALYDETRDTP